MPNIKIGGIVMNLTRRVLITILATVMISNVLTVVQPTAAQSENSNCKQVKGDLVVNFGPGTASGVLTNGSILNGTFESVFAPGSVVPTADPTSITFTGDSSITTNKGVVVTHDVYLIDFVLTLGPGMLRIDPASSSGEFAGATGLIYLNPKVEGPFGHAELTGQICINR
jgi:hypothetical protein